MNVVVGILGTATVFVVFASSYLLHADPCMDLDTLSPDCLPDRAR